MEFLVHIEVRLPADMAQDKRQDLLDKERRRGQELRNAGVIKRVWRIPGRHASTGLYEAKDATELHDVITSLPLHPWLDVQVVPLALHYLEAEDSNQTS